MLDYPKNTIWYVRATSAYGKELSEGSAVAVRLQRKGLANTAKTYLLTCAHVVRGTSADGKPGFGPVLPNIRVWPPEVGFNDEQATNARIKDDIKPLPGGDVSGNVLKDTSNDWVVLEILDDQVAANSPTVSVWADTGIPEARYQICGYPGGENSFLRGIVVPTRTPETFPFRDEFQGTLRLTGDGTRPGISGGGVFQEPTWRFAGLHRARDSEILGLHAVSATAIAGILSRSPFELVASAFVPSVLKHYANAVLANRNLSEKCFNGTYLPLFCDTSPPVGNCSDKHRDAVDVIIDHCRINTTSAGRLVFLGQFGSGKTCLLREALKRLAAAYLDGRLDVVPVLIALRDFDSSNSLLELVGAAIGRYAKTTGEDIRQSLISSRFAFLLDGLDEIVGLNPLSTVRRLLDEIERLLEEGNGAHVAILTSRNTFFQTQVQEGRLRDFRRFYICPWGEEEWRKCIDSLHLSADETQRLAQQYDHSGLAAKPLFARLILQHRDRVLHSGDAITSSSLYDFYVTDTLQYQATNRQGVLTEEQRREGMRAVALEMFFNNSSSISQETLQQVADRLPFATLGDSTFLLDLQNGSLLERAAGAEFQFTHKSVMEYLVADALVLSIRASKFETLSRRYVYNEIWEFMAPLVTDKDVDILFAELARNPERHFFATAIVLIRRLREDREIPRMERYTDVIIQRIRDEAPQAIQARLVAGFGAWRCPPETRLTDVIRQAYDSRPHGILARIFWFTLKYFSEQAGTTVELPKGPPGDVYEPEYAADLFQDEETAIESFLIVDGGVATDPSKPVWIVRMATSLVLSSHGETRLIPRLLADINSSSETIRENAVLSFTNLVSSPAGQSGKLQSELQKALECMETNQADRVRQTLRDAHILCPNGEGERA